jgi:hypothetical protein
MGLYFERKMPIISLIFLAKNIFLNHNIGPRSDVESLMARVKEAVAEYEAATSQAFSGHDIEKARCAFYESSFSAEN